MIDVLRKTVEQEIEILREISIFIKRTETASPAEKMLLAESMESLRSRMRENNNQIAEILKSIPISESDKTKKTAEVINKKENKKVQVLGEVMPRIQERENFLKELDITESILKKIKKKKAVREVEVSGFKEASGYLKIANKLFLSRANQLTKKGYFGPLHVELKKANLDILFETYVSAMLFSAFLSFFAATFLAVFLIFFDISFSWPIIQFYTGSFIARALKVVLIPLLAPIAVLIILYFYPSIESRSISGRINEELPFAVIHMSSISGSGIEPTEIFKIVALSKEYPFLRKEIRKILNQVNVYGYDLVTALNNVSKGTSSSSLAELLAGLATTINSGGSLSDFFQKRADTLLINYKLEKEKAIKIAETSMDIYISVVIAAPMILMLMLVMVSVSGIQIGFTPYELTFITIGGVALINVAFLAYLQTKRGVY